MIILRCVIGRERCNLRSDLALARRTQGLLVDLSRFKRRLPLCFTLRINRTAIIGADVISLTIALGRIVTLPETGEHLRQTHPRRIKGHFNHFGMIAPLRSPRMQGPLVSQYRFIIARNIAIRITTLNIQDAGQFGHSSLRTPEAAHTEHDRFC